MRLTFFSIVSVITLITNLFASATATTEDLTSCIREIDPDLYVAQMNGHNLRLVAERVRPSNLPSWSLYMSIQSNPRITDVVASFRDGEGNPLQKGSTSEGSEKALEILSEVSCEANEMWMVYVTSLRTPRKISSEEAEIYRQTYQRSMVHGTVGGYDPEALSGEGSFFDSIKMFVTVTSNPGAQLVSHMGITASVEGTLNRPKGISLHLHSFAAQFMLQRNPRLKFMVNTPVSVMRGIIISGLPRRSVFVSTRETAYSVQRWEAIIAERAGLSFEDFMKTPQGIEANESILRQIDSNIDNCQRMLVEKEDLKRAVKDFIKDKTTQQVAEDIKKGSEDDYRKHLTFLDAYLFLHDVHDGEVVPSTSKREAHLRRELYKEFEAFRAPPSSEFCSDDHLPRLIKEHPPILSVNVDEETGRRKFTFYNPDNPTEPFLIIDESNSQVYDWLYKRSFGQSGTDYLVVDLAALAEARPLAPYDTGEAKE